MMRCSRNSEPRRSTSVSCLGGLHAQLQGKGLWYRVCQSKQAQIDADWYGASLSHFVFSTGPSQALLVFFLYSGGRHASFYFTILA